MNRYRIYRQAMLQMISCGAIALLIAGCGSDKSKKSAAGGKSGAEEKASATTESTTETASATADPADTAPHTGTLDFYTERYISSSERLARRQGRIQQELASAGGAEQ